MSAIAGETGLVESGPSGLGLDLDTLAEGAILSSVAAAERLRGAPDARITRALLRLVDQGDLLARLLAVRALSTRLTAEVDRTLVRVLDEPDLAEQAAWALLERTPVRDGIPGLTRLVSSGDFSAMPAQLALERWSALAGEHIEREIRRALALCSSAAGCSRLAETLALVSRPIGHPVLDLHRGRGPDMTGRGLRVAQVLLRGKVDPDLESAGSGDGGGVVTLLVHLARELGRTEGVERSVIIARPREDPTGAIDSLGPGAAIVRLPFGPNEQVPIEAMWEHRAQVEQALLAALAVHGPIDVAHLRYADAGTFAAARALRRAGVRVVFTLAPDPHALIAEGERKQTVTRRSFGAAELSEHNLFRLRLVDELADRADRIVTLPRVGGRRDLERLVGRSLCPRRTASIPEGIAIAPLDRALERAARPGSALPAVAAELASAIALLGEHRLGLPLILSAGRFHPIKGFPRLVEAWAGDRTLVERFNLVIVGGELDSPSPGEQAVIDEIDAAVRRHPGANGGLVLLGSRPHDDVAGLLAITRYGLSGAVAPAGVYACSSAKEEFGVAILEALASGLAVVAPAGGGPDTYLTHDVDGVLVAPARVDTLRAGLHRAAELAVDEARAERAMALVRARFAIAPVASALGATYRRAAKPQ